MKVVMRIEPVEEGFRPIFDVTYSSGDVETYARTGQSFSSVREAEAAGRELVRELRTEMNRIGREVACKGLMELS